MSNSIANSMVRVVEPARDQSHSQADLQHETPTERQVVLRRVAEILVCPDCHGEIEVPSWNRPLGKMVPEIHCDHCGSVGRIDENQFHLGGFSKSELRMDALNRLKEDAKRRLGKFYSLAINVLAPVMMQNVVSPFLKSFDLSKDLVADLGSGTSSYSDQVICVDGGDYPNVHVTADLANLPFRDESLSGIVSVAVLEHVPNPKDHVNEFSRVLKPGGRILCYIPFMQGYHASPHDYQRYTIRGMEKLFEDFVDVRVSIGSGPTSGLIWVLQEWLALVFSLGSLRLYRILVPFTWILSPLKYFDLLLAKHPAAGVIASAFVVEARKASDSISDRNE